MGRRLTLADLQGHFQFPAQALSLLFETFAFPLEARVLFLQPFDIALLRLDLPLGSVQIFSWNIR